MSKYTNVSLGDREVESIKRLRVAIKKSWAKTDPHAANMIELNSREIIALALTYYEQRKAYEGKS